MNGTGSQQDVGLDMYTPTRKAIGAFLRPLRALLLALLVFQGCKALNRLCGSAAEYRSLGLFLPTRLRSLKYSGAFFSVRRVVSLYRLLSRIPDALSSSWNATPATYWGVCR